MSSDPTLPGRARKAAETIIEVYRALGSHTDDYDRAWFAKEWLYDAADTLESNPGVAGPTNTKTVDKQVK